MKTSPQVSESPLSSLYHTPLWTGEGGQGAAQFVTQQCYLRKQPHGTEFRLCQPQPLPALASLASPEPKPQSVELKSTISGKLITK